MAILLLFTLCLTASFSLAEDAIILIVWCWDDAFNGAGMRAAADLYTVQHPEVKVDVQIIPNMNLAFSSAVTGQQYDLLPDIILVQDRDLDKQVNLYNVFTDLTDSGIDFTRFSPYKVQAATSGGLNYGIPFDNGVVCLFTAPTCWSRQVYRYRHHRHHLGTVHQSWYGCEGKAGHSHAEDSH